ncbi:MAG: polysaccharide biosynthesis protein, partial [Prevotella sp.]|nr:polysaccharide biosynthesis protein [Prevotella sp.]
MYGNLSGVAMIQGSSILLNVFFGPVANAAFAVANQIYNALGTLGNTVIIAFRPAMIKSYSEKNYDNLDHLFYIHNKVLSYLMIGVSLPLIFLMPTILHWWLDEVPQESVVFSRLFVVYIFILVMSNPISTIIQATGRVKYYSLAVETITILCLPVAWLLFRLGYPSFTLFVVMI